MPAAKPSEVRPATPQKKLRQLLAAARSAQKDIDEIAGGMGEEIKTAVEKHHLHRKAFNVVKMADRMEPEKLADFLDNLEHYLEVSGLNERAASAPRLGMGDEPNETAADELEQARAARRKKDFPQPEGEAAE